MLLSGAVSSPQSSSPPVCCQDGRAEADGRRAARLQHSLPPRLQRLQEGHGQVWPDPDTDFRHGKWVMSCLVPPFGCVLGMVLFLSVLTSRFARVRTAPSTGPTTGDSRRTATDRQAVRWLPYVFPPSLQRLRKGGG